MEVPHRREPRTAPEGSNANARAIRTLSDAQPQARAPGSRQRPGLTMTRLDAPGS